LGLPTLTRAIATTLANTQGSRELGGETPPLRLIGLKNEVIRVSGDLGAIGPALVQALVQVLIRLFVKNL
jgi:hypothetical protein